MNLGFIPSLQSSLPFLISFVGFGAGQDYTKSFEGEKIAIARQLARNSWTGNL
jgi:hypothetical protein